MATGTIIIRWLIAWRGPAGRSEGEQHHPTWHKRNWTPVCRFCRGLRTGNTSTSRLPDRMVVDTYAPNPRALGGQRSMARRAIFMLC
jgi:hypothetical protein